MAAITPFSGARMFKSLQALVLLVSIAAFIVTVSTGEALAKKKSSKNSPNLKYASLVLDADTGEILSQSNPDKRLHPASLTKIMTLLMLFEAIDQGRVKLTDSIPISKYAAGMSPSKIGLPAGSSIRVKDAILALVTKSANDISAAIAEFLGGTERNFAQKMTARAREIGMSNTTFKNAHGLHHPEQISTARDMGRLARFVILRYPEYYRYFSTKNFTYKNHNYRNHNRLMETYKGMDGMKTGYIGPSGFNLVASAVRNDRRIIGVVFGGRTTQSRNDHMAELLDRGFAKMGDLRIAKAAPRAAKTNDMSDFKNRITPVPTPKPEITLNTQALEAPILSSALSPSALNPSALKPSDTMPPAVQIMPLLPEETAQAAPPPLEESFEELIGEGDFDPAVYKRIETGMSAIAALKGSTANPKDLQRIVAAAHNQAPAPAQKNILSLPPSAARVSYAPPVSIKSNQPWSVQIGAFTSRAATDEAIQRTLRKLPAPYSSAQAVIAPLKTNDGWLFRGRLTGFTKTEALAACNYISDCLPVAPAN